ncbi:membrane protein [Streptomyces xanthophaeus]|uniref:Membrane protein n=1 Tax=Streptomyces xanthophaeus TaxID=67385 RepID=A0A919GUV4_9ACTN|nr:membrane protein [Streptomyces xanthophaeus]GHI84991.1 membrane protein [Streptomyces xanthophaeus]
MTKLLLSLHVLAAVLAVGPVTVAASMFPKALRHADGAPDDPGALATLRTLHRICRVYAGIGIAVPVFGFATAGSLGVLGSGWLITSVVLTAAAAAVLGLLILPAQDEALAAAQAPGPGLRPGPGSGPGPGPGPASRTTAARLAMLTGVFNLLWATVTVLMIVRPGSTTGA